MAEAQYIQYGALGLCFFIVYWLGTKMDKIENALSTLSVEIAKRPCQVKKDDKPA